ncbi:hypothetical protein LINGRAPRIM_LOCUS2279 [Linum grandiflorum]
MAMAQVVNLNPLLSSGAPTESNDLFRLRCLPTGIKDRRRCKIKINCLFSKGGREEQAKKALESALGGKKSEFEKWSKEIKKREESRSVSGGDSSGGGGGGGGWFGSGGPFGGAGENFWPEAQQACLALLGMVGIYLVLAKGEVMVAVVCNPLLRTLRGTRDGLTFISSKFAGGNADVGDSSGKEAYDVRVSAKDRVVKKWGTD